MKKTIIAAGALAALTLPASVLAFSVKTGDSSYVGPEEIIDGSLYAASASLTIDGKVNGDLICAGASVTVHGEIEGDVICAAEKITIDGKVGGNVRTLSEELRINGEVQRNAQAAASRVILEKDSSIGWDGAFYAESLEARGEVKKDLYGAVKQATLAGSIGKNIRLRLASTPDAQLQVPESASIAGDLVYTANTAAEIHEKASLKGKTIFNQAATKPKESPRAKVLDVVISMFAAAAVGLAIISLWPGKVLDLNANILAKPWLSMLAGVGFLAITPLAALVLILTFVGAPLGLLIALAWIAGLIVGKTIAALAVGEVIRTRFLTKAKAPMWSLPIGIATCWTLFQLPIAGQALAMLAASAGVGGICLSLFKAKQ